MTLFVAMILTIGLLALVWISGVRRTTDIMQLRGLQITALALIPAIALGVYIMVGTSAALQPDAPSEARGGHAGSLEPLAAGLAAKLAANPDDAQGWKLLASTYDYLGRPEEAREAQARAESIQDAHDPEQATESLRARLQKNPRDGEGWALLGRSYQSQRLFELSADAFSRATELRPKDAALWADRADAQAAAQDGRLVPVEKFIDKALRLNPNEPKALWLAGTLALEKSDKAKALGYWRRLEKILPEGDPQREIILANIAELTPDPVSPSARALHGTVSLSPALAATVRPDDIVFVFARAANGAPMPLAAWRTRASGFPLPFTLDQTTLLSPDRTLDSVDTLVVGARISRSGNATPAPGDWEATPLTVRRNARSGLSLVIDHPVK